MADGSLESDCTRMLYILKILHILFMLWLGICASPVLKSTLDEGLEILFGQRNSIEAKSLELTSLETRDANAGVPMASYVVG